MGTGKEVRCKDCGNEWFIMKGKGMSGQSVPKPLKNTDGKIICPECKSANVEETGSTILWD